MTPINRRHLRKFIDEYTTWLSVSFGNHTFGEDEEPENKEEKCDTEAIRIVLDVRGREQYDG